MRSMLLSLSLLSGCVAPEAIDQARHEAAICHGHAADAALPLEARQIAADETRAWRAQHLALTGDDVPGAATWPALPAELDAVPGGAPGVEAPR